MREILQNIENNLYGYCQHLGNNELHLIYNKTFETKDECIKFAEEYERMKSIPKPDTKFRKIKKPK